MNILNGQEAFSALMAGKNIMCRAVGELIEFNDLDQFPATIFAMPNYEFCVKIESIELAGISFLKPFNLDEVAADQDIYICENYSRITKCQFIPNRIEMTGAIESGFVQRDRENASKQLQAIQKALGIETEIYYQEMDYKALLAEKTAEVKKRNTAKKSKASPESIQPVLPTGAESSNTPWEEINTDPIKLVENTTDLNKVEETERTQISTSYGSNIKSEDIFKTIESSIANTTSIETVDSLIFRIKTDPLLNDEQIKDLVKFAQSRMSKLSAPLELAKNEMIKTDIINVEMIEPDLASFDESAEYQSLLNDLINRAQEAMIPAEATKLTGYTKSWTEIQRKPLLDVIHKRLIELNPETTPVPETPSLMVRIQGAINEHELNELLPEIRSRHPDIQPKLMGYVRARRFELENSATTVVPQ